MAGNVTESSSDTAQQQRKIPGKPFVKGDKRINRKGRPKSFDQLRALAQQIAHEPISEGNTITVAEAILRTMAKENPARFVEIAYGKVPDEVQNSGEVKHTITVEYIDAVNTTALTRRADDDQESGTAL